MIPGNKYFQKLRPGTINFNLVCFCPSTVLSRSTILSRKKLTYLKVTAKIAAVPTNVTYRQLG